MAASVCSPAPFRSRLFPCLIACLATASILGCRKDPYPCVKVSGKVTYEDGSLIPAERIRIQFVSQTPPVDPKTSPKTGSAEASRTTGRFDSDDVCPGGRDYLGRAQGRYPMHSQGLTDARPCSGGILGPCQDAVDRA